uniref:Dihydroorotate dehydrogenase (Quinone), mitochondrial-like n=1 Tax=Saccoglossus kowalevskii TaxID=10224 RepID=A0ABM0MPX8_SACKO
MFAGICTYAGQERFYREILMPTVRTVMDADRAHVFAVKMAACGLVPRNNYTDPSLLSTKLWNMKFSNPIGLAAGFDKNAEAINGLHKMGFGFVEVGSITPEPQPGNPKPRVFRLVQECAIINRYQCFVLKSCVYAQTLCLWSANEMQSIAIFVV